MSSVSIDGHRKSREVIRLIQCHQCSLPFRTPLRLPCGNTLCRSCLPSIYKRENITYPMNAERKERFRCPFYGKKRCKIEEHSLGDCSVDITLNKVVDIFAKQVTRLSDLEDDDSGQCDQEERPEDPEFLSDSEHSKSLLKAYLLAETGELKYSEDVLQEEFDEEDIDTERKSQTFLHHLRVALRNELDCQVCYALMLNPFTTSCGHTFCRNCVLRVLDHSTLCPICRRRVHQVRYAPGEPENEHISQLIAKLFPKQFKLRQEVATEEEHVLKDLSTIPLFVCLALGFPMMPVYLHVFEPRYRLLIRRTLEHGGRKFGLVMYNQTNAEQGDMGVTQFMQCGTLLHIDRYELLPDGRILVEARGISRFKVLEWERLDGYFVGKTEPIEDISIPDEESLEVRETEGPGIYPRADDPGLEQLENLSTEQLMQISMDFVTRKKAEAAPWLHQRVLTAYGEPPSDPAVFPYWFGSVLPIFEKERYSLLPTTSVRERLKITATWVKVLDDVECIILTSLFPFPLPFSISLIFNPNNSNSNGPPAETTSAQPESQSEINHNRNDIILSISKSLILTSSFIAIILIRLIRLVVSRELGPEGTYMGYRYRRRRDRRRRRGVGRNLGPPLEENGGEPMGPTVAVA